MNEKVKVTLNLDLEGMVYVHAEAERRGISVDALVLEFVDQGMRRLAIQAAWDEFVEEIIFDLARQVEEMETSLDVQAARERSRKGGGGDD